MFSLPEMYVSERNQKHHRQKVNGVSVVMEELERGFVWLHVCLLLLPGKRAAGFLKAWKLQCWKVPLLGSGPETLVFRSHSRGMLQC